ncbi:glutaredoxin family protein [Gilvimarinus xylanilyticus]|uniref:Glutaredoxin family protein n=1 Tax=Gilvimarinus xylanilyticus TaxID=2944139 RepID=A0A9X2I2A0_9GAMM|nr:glutaredoxin family protein [Gilvimarinus xylanilyticus]MCP8898821.1 glutaredoxin family protein [Gilvimarinus xylanilyticus]
MRLTLLTTASCHLCEHAQAIVDAYPGGLDLRRFDIACDDEMIERYGLRIPVLRADTGDELDWPFTSRQLDEFICALPRAHPPAG